MNTLIVKSLLLPPGIIILILLLALLLLPFARGSSVMLLCVSIASLYLLSTEAVSCYLLGSLQQYPALNLAQLPDKQAQAIVVLAGGNRPAPEYGGFMPAASGLMRQRYAAKLYEQAPLPIFIAGGGQANDSVAEAKLMQNVLKDSFNVPTFWIDRESTNTYENGLYLKQILQRYDIKRFYLVTSAWHMPRAMWVFEHLGFEPIAAPTDFVKQDCSARLWQAWLPKATYLQQSSRALQEHLSMLWYKWHYHAAVERG